jgi:hypothetical protein
LLGWCRILPGGDLKRVSGGDPLDIHDVAKVSQAFDQTVFLLVGGTAIEVIVETTRRPSRKHGNVRVVALSKSGRARDV